MTATAAARAVPRTWQLSSEALAITGRLQKAPGGSRGPGRRRRQDRTAVVRRMLAPPFLAGDAKARHVRKLST